MSPDPSTPKTVAQRTRHVRNNLNYVSMDDAAELLGCSPKTVRRRIADGTLPATRFGKRLIRIHLDDLDKLLRPIPHARVGGAS